MLDNCSQGTFVRRDVLEFLDATVGQTTVTVRTMLVSSTEKSCAIEGLKVKSIHETTTVDLPKAYSQQSLPVDQMKSQPKNVSTNDLTCMRLLMKAQSLMQMYQLGY